VRTTNDNAQRRNAPVFEQVSSSFRSSVSAFESPVAAQ
jgi:hypothetical protein